MTKKWLIFMLGCFLIAVFFVVFVAAEVRALRSERAVMETAIAEFQKELDDANCALLYLKRASEIDARTIREFESKAAKKDAEFNAVRSDIVCSDIDSLVDDGVREFITRAWEAAVCNADDTQMRTAAKASD